MRCSRAHITAANVICLTCYHKSSLRRPKLRSPSFYCFDDLVINPNKSTAIPSATRHRMWLKSWSSSRDNNYFCDKRFSNSCCHLVLTQLPSYVFHSSLLSPSVPPSLLLSLFLGSVSPFAFLAPFSLMFFLCSPLRTMIITFTYNMK